MVSERLDVTIHLDHVDVEHELELKATPSWNTPSHPNSLEILGNLTLGKGAVVTGLLLWNGNTLLKGKLLSKAAARRKYEEVVDRNVTVPPPPRDPAILEKTGESTYSLSVFPVILNGSRKLRIRYLIPSVFQAGAHQIPFPHAFSRLASLTLRGAEGVPGYALTSLRMDGSETTVKNEDAVETPLSLDPEAFQHFLAYRPWETGTGAWLRHVQPLFGQAQGSRACVGTMQDAKGVTGHIAHFFFRPPAGFADPSPGGNTRIVAAITDGVDTVRKEVTGEPIGLRWAESLRIFSRKELERDITWRLYEGDSVAKEKTETPDVLDLEDGAQFARSFGGVPFYPLAKAMPPSLAAAWGFVDTKYSLLALERDSLPAEIAKRYAEAGVPALNPEDIFPEDGLPDSIPLTAWLIQRNMNRDDLLKPLDPSAIAPGSLPPGISWRFRDGLVLVEIDRSALVRGLRVSLHGLDGKLLKEWGTGDMSGGRLAWSPREAAYASGICLLRIVSGSRIHSARVVLR